MRKRVSARACCVPSAPCGLQKCKGLQDAQAQRDVLEGAARAECEPLADLGQACAGEDKATAVPCDSTTSAHCLHKPGAYLCTCACIRAPARPYRCPCVWVCACSAVCAYARVCSTSCVPLLYMYLFFWCSMNASGASCTSLRCGALLLTCDTHKGVAKKVPGISRPAPPPPPSLSLAGQWFKASVAIRSKADVCTPPAGGKAWRAEPLWCFPLQVNPLFLGTVFCCTWQQAQVILFFKSARRGRVLYAYPGCLMHILDVPHA